MAHAPAQCFGSPPPPPGALGRVKGSITVRFLLERGDLRWRAIECVLVKLEFILKLKIKRNNWLLADTCPQAANHCALFEFETVLKFYNLGPRSLS